MNEVIKTGIAALDEQIGGGLKKGTVTIIYGNPKATSVYLHRMMSYNVQETSKVKFLKVDCVNDIDVETFKTIMEMACKNKFVVVVTFYESNYTQKNELSNVVKNMADNIFLFVSSYVSITLEVLKNRSHGLHDVKFNLLKYGIKRNRDVAKSKGDIEKNIKKFGKRNGNYNLRYTIGSFLLTKRLTELLTRLSYRRSGDYISTGGMPLEI